MHTIARSLVLCFLISGSVQAISLTLASPLMPQPLLKKRTDKIVVIQKPLTQAVCGAILIVGFSMSALLLSHSIKKTIETKLKNKKQKMSEKDSVFSRSAKEK